MLTRKQRIGLNFVHEWPVADDSYVWANEGWKRIVTRHVFNFLVNDIPSELIETKEVVENCYIRLTEEGKTVVKWLL
jgi:hypothetical protein